MQIHMRLKALALLLALSTAGAATVKVQSGDTLYRLAVRHGTSVQAILGVNPGLDASKLRAGQVLQVPARAGATGSPNGRAVVRPASIRVQTVMPVQGRITTPYSAAHPGLDVAAPFGTQIRAVLGGTVRESRFDGRTGWGWTIVVERSDGYTTRYSHNSVNLVKVGQRVAAGQVIARVGSTGKSTGPHVDFRVYLAGVQVNPHSIL